MRITHYYRKVIKCFPIFAKNRTKISFLAKKHVNLHRKAAESGYFYANNQTNTLMELAGKVIAVLEARGGVSKTTGNPWKMQDYVIETHEQFPRKMAFTVFGEDKINQFNIQMGEEINVFFDINGREYNGRWYNDIRAWRIDRVVPGQEPNPANPAAAQPMPNGAQPFPPAPTEAPAPAPAPTFATEEDTTSDLPF